MAKTIVITGASSGFGKGVAQKLAEQGHNLVLAARREDAIENLAKELGNAIAVPTDVASPAEIQHLASRAISGYGSIDVWINNAGVGAIGVFTEIPLEDQIRMVETNLHGTIAGSYTALEYFVKRDQGTLINIASITAKIAMPYYTVYGATKSAIQSMSSSIREELALNEQKDIHICVVNPWATDTSFFEHAGNYSGHTPRMPAIDDPWDVVDAIVGLLDDPKDEVDVSLQTKGSVLGSHLTPRLTETASAKMTHKYLMEDAPPAENTPGSIHTPMDAGTGVEGNIRERIAEEDRKKEG